MTPEDILATPARRLTRAQREQYFEAGYVCVPGIISAEWLARLNAVTVEFVERSRAEQESGTYFDLAPGHCADQPQIRRIKRPDEAHPTYWAFVEEQLAGIAADVVGTDVVFHHSKLNFKWHDGHDDVRWHQDAQFYPHTNYAVMAIGTYLVDVSVDNGALAVVAGSHKGELYDQYDHDGQWAGCLKDADVERINTSAVEYLEGPAGSITIHNCRTVHGSPPSRVDDGRPLLINAFAAADARPYTPNPDPSVHAGQVVHGAPARWAHHDPRPCLIPPDWSGGYSSIFAAQAGEDN